MSLLLHQIVLRQAERSPSSKALGCKDQWFDYQTVSRQIRSVAAGLQKLGLMQHERVAIYLPKTPEAVFSYFGATAAGGVMVPVNPVLKAPQVFHILKDCNVRVLMTNKARYQQLEAEIHQCHDLMQVILVDGGLADEDPVNHLLPDSAFVNRQSASPMNWANFLKPCAWWEPVSSIDADMAAILYTSGSTGKPKGVVLSHRNMVTGASSVAQYLGNTPEDRLLCVLPFSFDYGFSQLTTAFLVGASCYLLEYLLPGDVIKTVEKQQITGLGLVPPLWVQIADLPWPQGAGDSLRYFTNTGGAMPTATLALLRQRFRYAKPYLMYGLTEAFRSCFLPPEQIDLRPGSMGKAIPNADVMVINELGEICGSHEPGELVHRGALVSMGYWNDPERTAERFRPAPCAIPGIPGKELAVWSGDIVRKDDDGYIYFVGRRDDMIKTSGYRVSPTEVEEVVYSSGLVAEVAAIGVPHFRLGQAIVLVVVSSSEIDEPSLIRHCQQCLPAYMVPIRVIQQTTLARNPNGKIDRKPLLEAYRRLFQDEEASVL
ncbi:acyl-CoA ligase (AMP-forming), exosortase A system-associated [Thalassotalea sp. G20_0]|uniref:acyl-CoA ligase (AMP-forming), exosortase A system-associated n=1 Tax=Thalassotalea sp. G20_0 TaxID=2821093 RepID=UPI001ADADC47|nr:acyl-CoA ligase (AMP-forming), exosortase A system-associated [Thalassotalea sp. G20_0]MBO9495113.1 acyl-CoA ligase (AMP-forming), exosortase A system-associated [Thalassotalea sp. G20_0]